MCFISGFNVDFLVVYVPLGEIKLIVQCLYVCLDKELNSINNVMVQILRLCMPENTLPLTNGRSIVSFELPKTIVRSTSSDDVGSDEVEKDSDEGLCIQTGLAI